ncbi:MAG: glycosyltransferase [Planctomycetes bacterium]|nr:glycosyltransferase [Planctomycetota bacterium]
MRVLMLGWEFPPHITGGLATACAGLCEGLHRHGVDVTFVIPRAHGDEDQSLVRVVGCNEIEVDDEWSERETVGVRERVHGRCAESAQLETREFAHAEPGERPSFVLPPADAPQPSAYATPATLDGWLATLAPHARTGVRSTSARRTPERDVTIERSSGEDSEIERLLQVEVRRHARRTLEFTGRYGGELFGEVERFARCVAALARREHFDLVHAHDWMTFPAGIAAARALGRPLACHVHACEYDRSGDHPDTRIRDLEQLGLDHADRVVCVSHYTAQQLARRYRVDESKLRVVHNAVNKSDQARATGSQRHIPEPVVLFLGRVTFQKGPDYFLEAAARVVAVEPRVKFVMVGSGDMLPKMIERAARMGLARNMHFTGFLKGADVERIYSLADIYVMPSVSEPFGISPLEALALDVPVIVSRQSGVSEVLRNALKVDFWDVQDIANKILALLRYPALREHLLDAGREEVRAMSWEERAGVLECVYREVAHA